MVVVVLLALVGCDAAATACTENSALAAARRHVDDTLRRPVASLEVLDLEQRGDVYEAEVAAWHARERRPLRYEGVGQDEDGDCRWEFRPGTGPSLAPS